MAEAWSWLKAIQGFLDPTRWLKDIMSMLRIY